MTRITVEINDELLALARAELGTDTKVATINAALAWVVRRKVVMDAIAAMNSVEIDYSGSAGSFRYGGGRDLDQLEEKAREAERAAQQAAADARPATCRASA